MPKKNISSLGMYLQGRLTLSCISGMIPKEYAALHEVSDLYLQYACTQENIQQSH